MLTAVVSRARLMGQRPCRSSLWKVSFTLSGLVSVGVCPLWPTHSHSRAESGQTLLWENGTYQWESKVRWLFAPLSDQMAVVIAWQSARLHVSPPLATTVPFLFFKERRIVQMRKMQAGILLQRGVSGRCLWASWQGGPGTPASFSSCHSIPGPFRSQSWKASLWRRVWLDAPVCWHPGLMVMGSQWWAVTFWGPTQDQK